MKNDKKHSRERMKDRQIALFQVMAEARLGTFHYHHYPNPNGHCSPLGKVNDNKKVQDKASIMYEFCEGFGKIWEKLVFIPSYSSSWMVHR